MRGRNPLAVIIQCMMLYFFFLLKSLPSGNSSRSKIAAARFQAESVGVRIKIGFLAARFLIVKSIRP